MIRKWGDPSLTPRERSDFIESTLGPDNLQRLFWFILAFLPISIVAFFANALMAHLYDVLIWNVVDLSLAILFLGLTIYARRKDHAIRWKHTLILVYVCYTLITMDGYYFSVRAESGENPWYILGVLMVAVLFRLPPRQFIPLFLVNHVIVTAILIAVERNQNELLLALTSGLNALILGLLAAWFLFHKQWETYEATALLTRRNVELNEVMAIAAHDLRSPLYSVKMLFDISVSRQNQKSPERMTAAYQEGSRACSEMLDLIERLLNSHALEHRVSGRRRRVDLAELASDALQRISPAAEFKGIGLQQEVVANSGIVTDPDTLRQVLDNLLSNAIKFSPRGATVTLSLREITRGWMFEVKDTGPGIPELDRGHIFEKYYRGRNQPSEGGSGSGLGLYIVKQFTEALGGIVDCSSNTPQGMIFRISLPRK
jgi:signal transduction histidine kinase